MRARLPGKRPRRRNAELDVALRLRRRVAVSLFAGPHSDVADAFTEEALRCRGSVGCGAEKVMLPNFVGKKY